MKEKIPINPETLKWARESASILIEEVAHKMKKPAEVIKDWENGISSPTYIQLEKLAYTIYKRPMALFFFPEPPEEVTPKKSFRTLPESELEELSPLFLRLFRRAQAMQINLEELNDGVNPASQKIFKDLSFKPGDSVETMVKAVRKYLGISIKTQISWKDTDVAFKIWRNSVEENGIFVFKNAFKQDEFSGFCLYDHEFPVIYINNSMPPTRQTFTLFHELAHLLLKASGITKRNDDFIKKIRGDNKKIEVLCNRFTGEFLVPKPDFERSISNIEIKKQTIQDLANRYKVSREVILRKCLDKRLISESYYEQKSEEWIQEAKKERSSSKGGNYYFNQATYLGDNYLSLVFKKYYQRKISLDQVAEYLGAKISSIAGLEMAFLGKGESA